MDDFRNAEFSALIDMLANYTARYSRLLAEGDRGEEFENSRKMMKLIQAEIEYRKNPADNPPFIDGQSTMNN